MKNYYVITNRKLVKGDFLEQIEKVAKLKPEAIILREKDLSESDYRYLVQKVKAVTDKYGVRLILHTYINVAKELGADGVHFPLGVMRDNYRRDSIFQIGCSVHSVDEALEAVKLGATYLLVSNIYETDCKPGEAAKGLKLIESVKEATNGRVPIIGLGGIGIGDGRLEEVMSVGAVGAAVMSGAMKL